MLRLSCGLGRAVPKTPHSFLPANPYRKESRMSGKISTERINELFAQKEKQEDLLILGIDNPAGLYALAHLHEEDENEEG